jgi:hypothetical protein
MGLNRLSNLRKEVALSALTVTYFICIWAQIMLFQEDAGAVGLAI